ncbi:hypothetical protein ACJJTC_008502 [Scirpophaga incertulas]
MTTENVHGKSPNGYKVKNEHAAMQNGYSKKKFDVAIVGGGLVGSLEALFLAKRGHRALKTVGLEQHMIENHGIPMVGRMIHKVDSSTYVIPYDTRTNQCIYSVGRNYLNSLLLNESESYTNVERHFNHKLIATDLKKGTLTFKRTDTNEEVNVNADLIIGADGAFSAVRKAMMKQPLFNYSQQYIEHGYLELCIPANEKGEFQMPPNYLHIWPRGTFMMIALPNQDCSWTVTLFMPFNTFKTIDSEDKLISFFKEYFPDSLPLIGEKKLIEDFFGGSPSPLVSVKCRPYNVNGKAVIIGDAAHAVVPFYGQGMNAGFEDCNVLDELFQKYGDDLEKILNEFSDTRWKDTYAISDLAMYNYKEMRDLVTRPSYRIRKAFDDLIFWAVSDFWVPLYNSVTFTLMPYSKCVENRRWQDKILYTCIVAGVVFTFLAFFFTRL